MSQITPFEFEGNAVRVVEVDGDPWFVAKDVCDVLELSNPTQALSMLDEDEKNTVTLNEGIRGNPNKSVVSEAGLYTLVLRCRSAVTPGSVPHRFRRWVTHEVLPTVRKTGSYSAANPKTPAEALLETVQQMVEHERRIAAVETRTEAVESKLAEFDGDTGYMSVLAFSRANNLGLPLHDSQRLGTRSGVLCRARGLRVGRVPDERFGRVNSYPVQILWDALDGLDGLTNSEGPQ